nr:sigma-70 family RNA polymerase sigma factor [Pseudenhygromyxa sp. WMMC2535]
MLLAWRGGDLRAGNLLFSRYFEIVERYFSNKTTGEVEDLVQQTFEACVQGRDRFEGRAPFRIYLLKIARYRLYKHWSARKKRRAEDIEKMSLADLGAGPSTLLAQQHNHKRLLDALRQIPLAQQELLELYYWEELSGPELAEFLGLSENTARSRLRRAKLALAEAMRKLERGLAVPESTESDIESWARGIRANSLRVREEPV